jgi:hypothetical protein
MVRTLSEHRRLGRGAGVDDLWPALASSDLTRWDVCRQHCLSGGPECATVNDVGPPVSLRRRRARGGGVIPAPVSSVKEP